MAETTTVLIVAQDRGDLATVPGLYGRGYCVGVYPEPRTGNTPSANPERFLQFTIEDKTVEQIDERYFQPWDRLIDMTVINGKPPGILRINVRNNNSNASETVGGFTEEGANEIIAAWNAKYPESNLETIDFPAYNVWTCQGFFTEQQGQEFEETVIEEGLDFQDRIRLFYCSETFCQFIENAGGIASGTAQNFDNNLVDGRTT